MHAHSDLKPYKLLVLLCSVVPPKERSSSCVLRLRFKLVSSSARCVCLQRLDVGTYEPTVPMNQQGVCMLAEGTYRLRCGNAAAGWAGVARRVCYLGSDREGCNTYETPVVRTYCAAATLWLGRSARRVCYLG